MPTISVVMIVKNEAHHLAACLDTVKDWADEIVVLDSGSTDETKQIALSYGAKWYEHSDWQGFGKQRQRAQNKATGDYVFWIDADERVTPPLQQSVLAAVAQDLPDTVYRVGRLSEVFGRQIRHSGWYPDYVVRLYRRDFTTYGNDLVHESVVLPPNTQIKTLNGELQHFTYSDLHQYLLKSVQYSEAWAQQRFEQGRRVSLTSAFIHAFAGFFKMYILKKGFSDGKQGLLLAALSSYSIFAKYASLWVKHINKKAVP